MTDSSNTSDSSDSSTDDRSLSARETQRSSAMREFPAVSGITLTKRISLSSSSSREETRSSSSSREEERSSRSETRKLRKGTTMKSVTNDLQYVANGSVDSPFTPEQNEKINASKRSSRSRSTSRKREVTSEEQSEEDDRFTIDCNTLVNEHIHAMLIYKSLSEIPKSLRSLSVLDARCMKLIGIDYPLDFCTIVTEMGVFVYTYCEAQRDICFVYNYEATTGFWEKTRDRTRSESKLSIYKRSEDSYSIFLVQLTNKCENFPKWMHDAGQLRTFPAVVNLYTNDRIERIDNCRVVLDGSFFTSFRLMLVIPTEFVFKLQNTYIHVGVNLETKRALLSGGTIYDEMRALMILHDEFTCKKGELVIEGPIATCKEFIQNCAEQEWGNPYETLVKKNNHILEYSPSGTRYVRCFLTKAVWLLPIMHKVNIERIVCYLKLTTKMILSMKTCIQEVSAVHPDWYSNVKNLIENFICRLTDWNEEGEQPSLCCEIKFVMEIVKISDRFVTNAKFVDMNACEAEIVELILRDVGDFKIPFRFDVGECAKLVRELESKEIRGSHLDDVLGHNLVTHETGMFYSPLEMRIFKSITEDQRGNYSV